MTIIAATGDGFTLYPLPHWQEVAQIIRENLTALRAYRDEKLAALDQNKDHPHHARNRQAIHDQHNQMESEMMKGYLKMINMHLEFVEKRPEFRHHKWTKSDPLGSPHKENIHPMYYALKQGRRWQPKVRRDQIYNGRRIRFHADTD